jgi:hypothetical protein
MLQHPFLEPLFEWANNIHYYAFGSSMKQEFGKWIDDPNSIISGNSDNSVEVFITGNLEFGKKYEKAILSSMQKIGYDLITIDAQRRLYSSNTIGYEDYTIAVVEKDRNIALLQTNMSQGMFRALSIFIHLIYHVMMKTSTTILIDDIGEGLDFDRSTKLIKLLIDLAENSNIQLVMSTNDEFVMNVVPLRYWQVIQRTGAECKIRNYQNSKEQFDNFKFTGLSNFDLLTTDYLNQPVTTEKASV